ncbi:MAG: CDP-glucose 4,6-dehydratase [Gammaproteobacteria bacterium RIFCSPHIGHO2_12_FULL_40_19]|nr:MAG: CDP-glucose 4,6-dehydratase [Gammaproteobacteria bacterium RIFCSPHIGHO2_12_FULL_40_19]
MNTAFWKDRRVLITGHTGFKGAWLSLWLQTLQAKPCGIALAPLTTPNLFSLAFVKKNMQSHIADILDFDKIQCIMHDFQPEIIFHLAAQPLVRYSYQNPVETYATNVMGTVHILEAAKSCESVKAIINVTSDKCYENKERIEGYRENERLGGHDPYSNSKACSELITQSYRDSFYKNLKKGLASARSGNVIGGGDWSVDRLIVDIMKNVIAEKPIIIRNPNAIRPWQHVLEPLSGYLLLAENLYQNTEKYSGAWNFGPNRQDPLTVENIVKKILSHWNQKNAGYIIEPDLNNLHEATLLQLDITKATTQLHWQPKLNLDTSIQWTSDWYQAWINTKELRNFSVNQIQAYQQLIQDKR